MPIHIAAKAITITITALSVISHPALAEPAATASSHTSIDPPLLEELNAIDSRGSKITSMSADFEQRKFTALMRKPLVSSGRILIDGAAMRWETNHPSQNVLLVTDKDVKIYYPAQHSLEVYSIDQQLAQMAASPLPRLKVLQERFAIEQIPTARLDPSADASKFLGLRLTPIAADLREHVQSVEVLLEVAEGYIVQADLTDADGDRTVIRFSAVQVNVNVGDVSLHVPPGVRVTHPLEGMRGASAGSSK